MNADEIYKKYVEPTAVEQDPDPFPNEDKNKWKFPEGYAGPKVKDPMDDWKSDFGTWNVMDPNTGFNYGGAEQGEEEAATPAFDIKDIQVSTDRSSSFIPLVTIRILYSVNGNWNGIATTQISQNPLSPGPGIDPKLLDMATQHLINEISIEVRDRLIAKPLKEKLFAKMDELHRKGL